MPGQVALYQNDPLWKDKPLGFSTDSTIGMFGCLLTSLAMVANAYGANETPDTLNEKMKAVNAFQGPWIRAAQIGNVVKNLRFMKNVECYGEVPAPMGDIDAWLAAGKPIIVEVDYAPDAGIQNHWIVIYAKQGEDYLIHDPWRGARNNETLVQKYGFGGTPTQLINRVMFIDGKPVAGGVPAAPPQPAKPPTQPPATPPNPPTTTATPGFTVVSLVSALTLRTQPHIAETTVIKRLPPNAKLAVLEGDIAKSKVGVQNQWLKVRDIEGQEGFVAAWYVSLAEDPVLGARETPTQPPDKPKSLIVRTSVESVTLRNQPVIAPETVIKLLPLNTELRVLEEGMPETKIGVQNQWLQVQDLQGTTGYVAAWLVKKSR